MNNTNENNKLIAEFMGVYSKENGYDYTKIGNIGVMYHTSWDWLMPVIENIENLGYEVQIRNTDCIIYQLLDTLEYKPVIGTISSASGKIYSTYTAVVEFIKEYNQNK